MEYKDKKKGNEVEEQTLRDDLNVTGGSGVHTNAKSEENDSRDYGKWALVATAIVLVAVAVVLWII